MRRNGISCRYILCSPWKIWHVKSQPKLAKAAMERLTYPGHYSLVLFHYTCCAHLSPSGSQPVLVKTWKSTRSISHHRFVEQYVTCVSFRVVSLIGKIFTKELSPCPTKDMKHTLVKNTRDVFLVSWWYWNDTTAMCNDSTTSWWFDI